MRILGLEIKRIERKDMPKNVKDNFAPGHEITNKGRDYLFGLKGSPFSVKKKQGYLHYDGIRIANNRIYFMWKGDEITSTAIVGLYTGEPCDITGIAGKQKVDLQ